MTRDLDGYDHTEREVIAAIEKAQRRHALIPLLIGLILLIALGASGTWFSIQSARETHVASAAAVDRNAQLTRQLTALTEQISAAQQAQNHEAVQDRNDSRRLLLAICDQIEAVARQAHLHVPPCPRVPTPNTP